MNETNIQLKELCYIVSLRNTLNNSRVRAEDKRNYWKNKAEKLSCEQAKIKALAAEKQYVAFKLKMAKHTKKYHKKVLKLLIQLAGTFYWDNGYVRAISLYNGDKENPSATYVDREKISQLAHDFLLDRAVEKLLT